MIGMSCPDFCALDFRETWENVSKAFTHWEIFSEADHDINKTAPVLKSFPDMDKMTYSVHAAISETNIAGLNDMMWEASIAEIRSEVESAASIDAHTVTVHPGLFSLSVKGLEERSIARSKESMKILDRISREYGVKIVIENMPSFIYMLGQNAKDLEFLLEETDLKICFDIGHANTMGQIDEMLETFRGRIGNIHIHDNMGDRDSHLTMGEGNIDFAKALSKLKGYKGNYIIEAKSLESAIVSKKKLEKLLG